ncbi:metal-dependent hydrolase [Devosia pacifica]|uniref:Metal-dependent hydrolase n=1 Tax=Devosia pacifica TaxID=1335967 RepID=A0A918S401_9HYPH|nr:SprT family zinc-dependent metalloprotease [Devosia pacifica]GHA22772.1 metal-dependent hydrolase [Devosia pacifica]
MRLTFPTFAPRTTNVEIDGRSVLVNVRKSARARSYRLTLTPKGEVMLTLPHSGRWGEAQAFLHRHQEWLAVRVRRHEERARLEPDDTVLVRGEPHRIRATGRLRGRVEISHDGTEPLLLVPGDAPHLQRRVIDWMKAEARRDFEQRSAHHARTLGVSVRSISIRSQSTRWGSCSSNGNLSYNWRLIAAPPFVLDYVAAHEVAHLVEMNHSPAFWKTVTRTLPDMERGRAWLKANGRELMTLGA